MVSTAQSPSSKNIEGHSSADAARQRQQSTYYDTEKDDLVFSAAHGISAVEFLEALRNQPKSCLREEASFHLIGTIAALSNDNVTLNLSQARNLVAIIETSLDTVTENCKQTTLNSAQMRLAVREALPIATYINTCRG